MSEDTDAKRPPRHRPSDDASDYEVGYGRPPVATRFKPGQCGNPKGRPKKPKSLHAALERELDCLVAVRENGKTKRLTKRELTARQVADKGCRGDLQAIRLMRDVMGAVGGIAASTPDASEAPSPLPIDGTDSAILAAFAALIRGGADLPDETPIDAPQPDQPRSDEQEPQADTLPLPSPTCH